MKFKEFTKLTSALLMLASAVEAKDMSEVKAIITETKTGVSMINNAEKPNHIKAIDSPTVMQNTDKEIIGDPKKAEFLQFLDGEITEENLKEIYSPSNNLKYALLYLNNNLVRNALKGFDSAKNNNYIFLIAFLNGDYDQYSEGIQNICKSELSQINNLLVAMGYVLYKNVKSGFMDEYMEKLTPFWDFLDESGYAEVLIKLGKERNEERCKQYAVQNKTIKEEYLKPFVDLLNNNSEQITQENLSNIINDFSINIDSINPAILLIINDPEMRNSLATLINAQNVNTLLRIVFLDFSDDNIEALLKDENFRVLLDNLKRLCSQNSTIQACMVDAFCKFYKIDPKKRNNIDKNLSSFLELNFLRHALAFHRDEITYFEFFIKHPKLAISFI